MKQLLIYPLTTLLLAFIWNSYVIDKADSAIRNTLAWSPADTTQFNQEKALAELRESIAGREQEPASEVYEDIQMFKQVPAGRLLRIMEMGFSRSLGVNCTHCHNPDDWASEEKNKKQITRDMMQMVGKINGELLSKIENLESENPTVNCTTCHRGQVKPALNLD